jgi:hypothetical protein
MHVAKEANAANIQAFRAIHPYASFPLRRCIKAAKPFERARLQNFEGSWRAKLLYDKRYMKKTAK